MAWDAGPRPRLRDSFRSGRKGAAMKEIVGFIGLGGMGMAMATNLLKAGFGLRVYNRTAEKARPLLEQGATPPRTPAQPTEPGGVLFTMLSDDRALGEATLLGNALPGRPGPCLH